MDTQVCLSVPITQFDIFKAFVKKMGWSYEVKDDLLQQFVASRPKGVNITDDEIMEELTAVRYSK